MYMVPYTILGYMHFSSADADIIDKLKKNVAFSGAVKEYV